MELGVIVWATNDMAPEQNAGHDQVSQLLSRWTEGDQEALKALIPIVYKGLRKIAHNRLRVEQYKLTLDTTAVVHEGYLRLAERPHAVLRHGVCGHAAGAC